MTEKSSPEGEVGPPETAGPPRVIEADRLFEGAREVRIEHEGVLYRLRITRRNKLILQK
jgi:hemin uptake protein HemP